MNFIKRLWCNHKWKLHAKKEYKWTEKVEGTWDRLTNISETHEVLICEKCGAIKKIKY